MSIGNIAKSHAALLAEITETATPEGSGAFWWLGQHTFVVKAGNNIFYIDPWFAAWDSRQVPPLLNANAIENADFVLVTHGHGDHLCPESLGGIAGTASQTLFISPKTEAVRLTDEAKIASNRIVALNAGEVWEQDGVRITAIKAKHEFFDEHPTLGFPYLGYVVETDGVAFYHSGDTINYEGLLTTLQQCPHLNAIFVPINGRDAERFTSNCLGNFTYQEAVELAGELRVGLVVPSHYDMFIGNQEDPQKFVRYLNAKYPDVKYWIGDYGALARF